MFSPFMLYVMTDNVFLKMKALVTTCVAMAPFTPFFTEVLYQNLRKASNKSEESIHFCKFPSTTGEVTVLRLNILLCWNLSD